MTDSTQTPLPDEPVESKPGLLRLAGVFVVLGAVFYFFLFPLPVLAADVAGISIRQKTEAGRVLTDPIVWLAKKVPPYGAYLKASRNLAEFIYAA
ncbi:MAG: hypothetical protein KDN19_01750 [Verrucomicrobiae bacterium]|nr:hypothetical protein [Verrucomicrobiae bacterium]